VPRNPFTDFWEFLIGASEDQLKLGGWRYLFVLLFLALIAASVYFAIRNWREDPSQRSGRHLGIWAVRVLLGGMWFQAMLWKLPLPASDGLRFWTEQETTRAAFEFHREFVSNFLLPNLHLFGPVVFLAELTFAVSFILGLGVRLAAALGILFVLQLWLGIYLPGNPAEWPWSYVFLIMVMFWFLLDAAGRSLGMDAWLRRNVPAVRDGKGLLGRFLHIAG
jgi:DoxX